MALLKANVHIRGVRPLFFHCFTPDTLSLEKREKTGVAGNDPEEWMRTFTTTKGRQLYLDPSYVFGCLREAAKYTKSGRGSIQSKLAATLQVLDPMVLIDRYVPEQLEDISTDPTEKVYIDVRGVKNPNTKGRNVRYRLALSVGWETTFTVLWDNTLVNRQQMEAVCVDAGTLVGLADGRNIGFGRFEVVSFEVEDAKKTTA